MQDYYLFMLAKHLQQKTKMFFVEKDYFSMTVESDFLDVKGDIYIR